MKRKLVSFVMAFSMVLTLFAGPAEAANFDPKACVVDGGMSHSVALGRNGEVYAWGDNSSGQLGLGAEVSRQETPTTLSDLPPVSAVAAGYSFTVALSSNGRVLEWGNGVYQTPTEVKDLENVSAIAAGQMACLALRDDGNVYQWIPGDTPQLVNGIRNVVAISTGASHFLALTRTGEVWSWGYNEKGQLGDGTTTERMTPQKIPELLDIVSIAAGATHSLAADCKGNVYGWGDNGYDQLGSGAADQQSLHPVKVEGLQKIVQVAAGNGSSLALDSSGKVYSWGYGEYGQNGSNTEISKDTPTQMTRIANATSIACGVYHDLAVNKNGELYTWGRNNYGQLGTKENGNSQSAAKVQSGIRAELKYSTCILDGISTWAEEEISDFYPRDMVPPSLMGDYQETITRAELAHLLLTVYEKERGVSVSIHESGKFKDISNHPMKESILKASNLGIVNGTSGNTFLPEGKVTRQEAVTMICRFAGKLNSTSIPTAGRSIGYYRDADQVASWAVPYVDYAYEQNIMKGSAGRFSPNGPFTVEQSLLTISRLLPEKTAKNRRG